MKPKTHKEFKQTNDTKSAEINIITLQLKNANQDPIRIKASKSKLHKKNEANPIKKTLKIIL